MKVILIDDEQLALDYLERQLTKISEVNVAGKFVNPLLGKEVIAATDVDVVFLDIHLPEINGIELAEQILELKPNLHIVFVTAYDEYAVKAFELDALDYVVKPIRTERLTKTMERIRERLGAGEVQAPSANRPIRLKVLQQVMLESSDGQLAPLHWRTTKAQELFLYMLQYRGQLTRKSVLIELLWPEYEPSKVYSQLYTAVYHIRKTLERYGDRFQITNTTEGYVLQLHHVTIDAEEWEQNIISAPPLSENTVELYADIVKQYSGNYLQEHDYWWAEGERHRLMTLWLRVAFQLAKWYDEAGRLEEASVLYHEICSRHPQAEEAYFALMQIYASMGNHLSVNRQFRSLTAALNDEIGEAPSPYITQWYMQWKAKAAGS